MAVNLPLKNPVVNAEHEAEEAVDIATHIFRKIHEVLQKEGNWANEPIISDNDEKDRDRRDPGRLPEELHLAEQSEAVVVVQDSCDMSRDESVRTSVDGGNALKPTSVR